MAKVIWPEGLKHTRQREEVCNVLLSADTPLSAGDIYDRIDKSCRIPISTIYRILEAFETGSLVEKTSIPGTETAFYKLCSEQHQHFATCLLCHRQIPLKGCPVAQLEIPASDDFIVTGHKVELYGYCKECAAARD